MNTVSTGGPLQSQPWPEELKVKHDKRLLVVTFDNGDVFDLPAEYLRVESPSAEVQGHGASQKVTVAGKKEVTITEIQPVGHYAVRLLFDDGHQTGLYSWNTLHKLGAEQSAIWARYLNALAEQNLSREHA